MAKLIAPIFIVGCPRSGTTLLRNLLRSHPNLSFPRETHFIPQFYLKYGDPSNDNEARKLLHRILRLRRMHRWTFPIDEAALVTSRSYAELIDGLFQTWAHSEGKTRWGDKTPHDVLHIATLAKIFPQARIIHLYRDGRDVARSWIRLPNGPENWYAAAEQWRTLVRAGRKAGAQLPTEMYCELRYEDLLGDLEGTMRGLCQFIGEPFVPEVLTQNVLQGPQREHRVAAIGTRDWGYNNQPAIVKGNLNKWKTEATLQQRILFESVAGDLLQELGYETEGHVRHIPFYERWGWRTHTLTMQCLVQLNTRSRQDLWAMAVKEPGMQISAWLGRR